MQTYILLRTELFNEGNQLMDLHGEAWNESWIGKEHEKTFHGEASDCWMDMSADSSMTDGEAAL